MFVYLYRKKIIKILQIVFESITKTDLLFYKKPEKDLSKYVVGLKEKKNPSFEFKIENNESIYNYIGIRQENKKPNLQKLAHPHPQFVNSSEKSEMALQPVRVVSGKGKEIPPPPPPPPPPHMYQEKNKISSSVNINSPAELSAKKNNSVHKEVQSPMMQMILAKRNKMKKSGNQNQRPLGGSIKQGSSGVNAFQVRMDALKARMSGSGDGSNWSASNSNKIFSEPLKSNVELFKDISKQESNMDNNNKLIEEEESDDSDEKDLCCICMENKSESVFVPCGHRCVCFGCGESIIKSNNKKCPICQEESSSLLKKVYDS